MRFLSLKTFVMYARRKMSTPNTHGLMESTKAAPIISSIDGGTVILYLLICYAVHPSGIGVSVPKCALGA